MKKIAIIGHGYVGKAMANYFGEHFPLVIHDIAYKNQGPVVSGESFLGYDQDEVNKCDMAVICVPTPMSEDGSVDLSIVQDVFSWLQVDLVLIKSTIPPGTTDVLSELHPEKRIVFSPEYIGEGKYNVPVYKGYPHPTDMRQHEFFIFGGRRPDTSRVINFFMRVSGPDAKYMQTEPRTAELVKYMENSWGATKVTFCNEFFEIAKAMGVDYKELRELLLLDGRLERMHTAVFEDSRGFGGKCFPKDVNGIVKHAERAGFEPKLLKQVLSSNDEFRAKQK
jgi:nucleotide sugar dehydrogenase